MSTMTVEALFRKKCAPCEGGIPALDEREVEALLPDFPGWRVVGGGTRIRRDWQARNFQAAIDFFDKVAALAESEGHHPDLHQVPPARRPPADALYRKRPRAFPTTTRGETVDPSSLKINNREIP